MIGERVGGTEVVDVEAEVASEHRSAAIGDGPYEKDLGGGGGDKVSGREESWGEELCGGERKEGEEEGDDGEHTHDGKGRGKGGNAEHPRRRK